MSSSPASSPQSNDLLPFVLLAYALSWSVAIPLALEKQGIVPQLLPMWTHYLVGYGPMLSALIVTAARRGLPDLKELGRRIIRWRVSPGWWVAAVSPLIFTCLFLLIRGLVSGNRFDPSSLGEVHFLPSLGIGALPLWTLTFGIGEETGWRGFALPRLQRGRSALSATAILTVVWGLWHLPQFFYLFDPAMAIGWAFGLFAGAIVLTWLFNSSGGSILIVAVWHGCFNFVTASTGGDGTLAAVVSIAVMVGAVLVVAIFKPERLSSREPDVV